MASGIYRGPPSGPRQGRRPALTGDPSGHCLHSAALAPIRAALSLERQPPGRPDRRAHAADESRAFAALTAQTSARLRCGGALPCLAS